MTAAKTTGHIENIAKVAGEVFPAIVAMAPLRIPCFWGRAWMFECRDTESKQNQVFKYQMLGMLEATDAAASKMKKPEDILLVDFDNQDK